MARSVAPDPGSAVSVGVATTSVAVRDDGRSLLVFTNDHATNVVYLSLGSAAAVLNSGLRVNAAGGTVAIAGSGSTNGYTGPVQAISTGASTPLLRVTV
jgi:hypothetical protein